MSDGIHHYVLDRVNRTHRPVDDVIAMAKAYGDRFIRRSRVLDRFYVSTIFLGFDHGFGGKPLLYETMAFDQQGHRGIGRSVLQERSCTWAEAEATHVGAVSFVFGKGPGNVSRRSNWRKTWIRGLRKMGKSAKRMRGSAGWCSFEPPMRKLVLTLLMAHKDYRRASIVLVRGEQLIRILRPRK